MKRRFDLILVVTLAGLVAGVASSSTGAEDVESVAPGPNAVTPACPSNDGDAAAVPATAGCDRPVGYTGGFSFLSASGGEKRAPSMAPG